MREERVCYVLSEAEQPVFTVEMTSFCMRCVAGRRGGFNHKLTYQAEPQIAQNMPLSCHYPHRHAWEDGARQFADLLFPHLTKAVFQGPSCSGVGCEWESPQDSGTLVLR